MHTLAHPKADSERQVITIQTTIGVTKLSEHMLKIGRSSLKYYHWDGRRMGEGMHPSPSFRHLLHPAASSLIYPAPCPVYACCVCSLSVACCSGAAPSAVGA
jgi:hypothetical protein